MPKTDPFDLKSEQSPGDFFKSIIGSNKAEDFAKMSAGYEKTKKQIAIQAKRVGQAQSLMAREYKQFVSSFKMQLNEFMGAISDVEHAASMLESLVEAMNSYARETENAARSLKEESAALHNMYGVWAKAIAKHDKSKSQKDATAVEIAHKAYTKAINNSMKNLGSGSFFTKNILDSFKKQANIETTAFFASAARILKGLEGFKKSLDENKSMLEIARREIKNEESRLRHYM